MTHESPLSFQNLFTEKVFTCRHHHYSLAQVASLSAGQRKTWPSRLFEGKFLLKIYLDLLIFTSYSLIYVDETCYIADTSWN